MKFNYGSSKSSDGRIYKITNTTNNRLYIGSTHSFKKRWYAHKGDLLANRHLNAFLQNDFNKCTSEAFLFEVLEVIPNNKEERLKREQHFLDQVYDNQKQCYNLRKDACNSRQGRKSKEPIDPTTDGRCKSPTEEVRKKRSESMLKGFEENPEWRKRASEHAKNVRWKDHSANITVTNQETKETVLITGTLEEWCKTKGLSYKAFNQLVNGKVKSSDGWFLGTEPPKYVERRGEKRKPLTEEHREKIAGGKHKGVVLTNIFGAELIIEANVKEQCRKLGFNYKSLLRVLTGEAQSINEWFLRD